MRKILLLMPLLLACNARSLPQTLNEKATCIAECYKRCLKDPCQEKYATAKLLGLTPEGFMICECLVENGVKTVDGKETMVLKRFGVIVREPKSQSDK